MTDEEVKSCFELFVNYLRDVGVAPYHPGLPIDVITIAYDEFICERYGKKFIFLLANFR